MASYTDVVAVVGGSVSNSYVTGTEMDTFAGLQSWGETWLAKTESDRAVAIVSACSWLETIEWAGKRCSPSSDDNSLPQALSWQRSDASCDGIAATCTMIPGEVRRAQMLLAYNLVMSPDSITGAPGGGGGAAAGTYVASQELGDLKISYAAYPNGEQSSNDCTSCANPEVINKFPWLSDILKCWANVSNGEGAKVILRVRS